MESKYIKFTILFVGVLLFASCFQSTPKDNLIVGKWKCTSSESVFYYESSPDEPQVIPQDENDSTTLEFTKEGVLRMSNGEEVLQANYSLNGDTIVLEDSTGHEKMNLAEIKELTKNRLVLLMTETGEEGDEIFHWEDTYEFEKI